LIFETKVIFEPKVVNRHRAHSGESGSVVVEAAVIVPVAMLIVLLAVQVCLWAHASTLVQGAATAGEQAATVFGGSPAAGQTAARQELTATASQVVMDPTVQAQATPGGVVQVKVSGTAEAIIPWLKLPVSATRSGLSQEFRTSG
jgi:hypothetical protein